MKKLFILIFLFTFSLSSFPQSSGEMMDEFEKFRSNMYSNYKNYLGEINTKYEQFLREAWSETKPEKPLPLPSLIPMPKPVVLDDSAPVVLDKNINATPIIVPKPDPEPSPIVDIEEKPINENANINVSYFGASISLRYDKNSSPHLAGADENSVADYWHQLCGGCCNNLLRDLYEQRNKRDLCDWAYFELCSKAANEMSSDNNEKEVLTAFLLCQSGFKVKMGRDNSNYLHLLLATNSTLCNCIYYTLSGVKYFAVNNPHFSGSLHILRRDFPETKALRLDVTSANKFEVNAIKGRNLASKKYPNVKTEIWVNKNLMDFYETYPMSVSDDRVIAGICLYALRKMDEVTSQIAYPALRDALDGLSEKDKVERLLNFVQTSLDYAEDDEVWGRERPFFSEESLYYPYSDCEDRSILFSRLVRDIVGVDVALVYYPMHIATAVAFSENVIGDYILINERKFTICDPTYIGAPVGLSMEELRDYIADVIVLE